MNLPHELVKRLDYAVGLLERAQESVRDPHLHKAIREFIETMAEDGWVPDEPWMAEPLRRQFEEREGGARHPEGPLPDVYEEFGRSVLRHIARGAHRCRP